MMRSLAAPNSLKRLALCGLTLALLLPFVAKPFHMDDPIFLRTAEQIHADPTDFFGFEINWYGYRQPMYEVNKNPPLASYYLAAVAAVGGWSEIALHLGMLIPTLALVLGLYQLATFAAPVPWIVVAFAVTAPVFLLSATSLMSDVPMLALWVGAVGVFLSALERGSPGRFALAGVLMGLCVIAKYFGLAVIPLLTVYAIARERRAGPWLISVAVALGMVVAFDLYTRGLYGFSPLLDVMSYATAPDVHAAQPRLQRGSIGLMFLGGGAIGSLLAAPLLWAPRALAIGAGVLTLLALALVQTLPSLPSAAHDPWLRGQEILFAAAGLHIFALAGSDLWRRRDPMALLIALWLVGAFCFAAFTNWTTNGRSILPAVVPIALLVGRGLPNGDRAIPRGAWVAIGLSAVIALEVTSADLRWADTAREAAAKLSKTPLGPGETLYYQGSWGFQRYMELAGVEKFAVGDTQLRPGDALILPENNTNVFQPPPQASRIVTVDRFDSGARVAIMSSKRRAGFYASFWGVLPYSFGGTEPERYATFRMTQPWAPEPRSKRGD